MNLNEQYLACAELDGLKNRHYYKCSDPWDGDCDVCGGKAPSSKHDWPDYSTRDALVGVIEKHFKGSPELEFRFVNEFYRVINSGFVSEATPIMSALLATPDQLREALLRATGKWKE